MTKKNCVHAIILLLALPVAVQASSINLPDFNTFIFGDFANSSDTQGRLAVGGNAYLDGYSVGTMLPPDPNRDTLVVGGDLNLTSGNVFNGNARVGGTLSGHGTTYDFTPQGDLITGNPVGVDFAVEKVRLQNLSLELANMSVNGTYNYQWGGYTSIAGDGSSPIQIFNIAGDQLYNAHTFNFLTNTIATDATILFNVSGETTGLSNMSMTSLESIRQNVLFNFYEATTVILSGIGVQGSILAPFAQVNGLNGVIWGDTVAGSWVGPVQQNYSPFNGYEEPVNPVPEPATMILLGTGLIGLAGVASKKKRT